jgi:hypothetical protein
VRRCCRRSDQKASLKSLPLFSLFLCPPKSHLYKVIVVHLTLTRTSDLAFIELLDTRTDVGMSVNNVIRKLVIPDEELKPELPDVIINSLIYIRTKVTRQYMYPAAIVPDMTSSHQEFSFVGGKNDRCGNSVYFTDWISFPSRVASWKKQIGRAQ